MATANESSGAIDATGQIASAHELRQVAQDTFGLRIQSGPDALPMSSHSPTEPRPFEEGPRVMSQRSEIAPVVSTSEPDPPLLAAPVSYNVFFYDREYGDLTDAITTESFDAGVQLVRDGLPVQADYVVEATWTRGIGEMEVRSPRGTVVTRVEPVADTDVIVQPPVIKAGTALQVGDAVPLEQLFVPLPEAA